MESKIPLPTDNIYKFYALFGLMLLVSNIVNAVLVLCFGRVGLNNGTL